MVIVVQPLIQILLQGFNRLIEFLAESDLVKLVENGLWKRSQIPFVCGLLALVFV